MQGVLGSAAGAPLSQTAGSETERSQRDASATQRQADNLSKAEKAAGIGQAEGDEGPSERDADGRRLWEAETARGEKQAQAESEPARQAKDPSGQSGGELDLTG
jgi:hypothetical protein